MKTKSAAAFILSLHLAWNPQFALARDQRLDSLIAHTRELSQNGSIPLIVMDLDETVVDSTDRRFAAFQRSAQTLCSTTAPRDCPLALNLRRSDLQRISNPYDSTSLFDRLGIKSPEFRKKWESTMVDEYLSGSGMELDDEVPGARSFISELGHAGAHVIYISARFESKQGFGTLQSLSHLGLLEWGWPKVILRPDHEDSLAFKVRAIRSIEFPEGQDSAVIALFENEPENLNAWSHEFPDAQAFFLERAVMKPEPLAGHPIRLRDFR